MGLHPPAHLIFLHDTKPCMNTTTVSGAAIPSKQVCPKTPLHLCTYSVQLIHHTARAQTLLDAVLTQVPRLVLLRSSISCVHLNVMPCQGQMLLYTPASSSSCCSSKSSCTSGNPDCNAMSTHCCRCWLKMTGSTPIFSWWSMISLCRSAWLMDWY